MGRRRGRGLAKPVVRAKSKENPAAPVLTDCPELKEAVAPAFFVSRTLTPMKIFATDNMDSSQSDMVQVEWDARSPITMTQVARYRSQSVDIRELVENYTEHREPRPACKSPLMGLWTNHSTDFDDETTGIKYRAQRMRGKGKRTRGRPSGVKAAISSKEILQQLESVLETKPEDDEPEPCQLFENQTRKSSRIAVASFSSSSPAGIPLELLESVKTPITSTQKVNSRIMTSSDMLQAKQSPILNVKSRDLMSNALTPKRLLSNVMDDLWQDEDLFDDDSFIIKATQGEFDGLSTKTVRTLKRKTNQTSPNVKLTGTCAKLSAPIGSCNNGGIAATGSTAIAPEVPFRSYYDSIKKGAKSPFRKTPSYSHACQGGSSSQVKILKPVKHQVKRLRSVEQVSRRKGNLRPVKHSTPNHSPTPFRIDTSMTDELLASLAEPDDLLDSQVAGTELLNSQSYRDTETTSPSRLSVIEARTLQPAAASPTKCSPPPKLCLLTSMVEKNQLGSVSPGHAPQEPDISQDLFPDDGFEDDFMQDEDDEISEGQLLAILDMVESQASQEKQQTAETKSKDVTALTHPTEFNTADQSVQAGRTCAPHPTGFNTADQSVEAGYTCDNAIPQLKQIKTTPTQAKRPIALLQHSKPIPATQQIRPTPTTQQTRPIPTTQQTRPIHTTQQTRPTPTIPTTQQTRPTPTTQQTRPTPTTQQTRPTPTTQQTRPTPTTQQTRTISTTQQTRPTPPTQQTRPIPTNQQTRPTPTTQQTKPKPTAQQTRPTPPTQQTRPIPTNQQTRPTPITQQTRPTPPAQQTRPTPPTQQTRPIPTNQQTRPTPITQQTRPTPPAQQTRPTPPTQEVRPTPTTQIQHTRPTAEPELTAVAKAVALSKQSLPVRSISPSDTAGGLGSGRDAKNNQQATAPTQKATCQKYSSEEIERKKQEALRKRHNRLRLKLK